MSGETKFTAGPWKWFGTNSQVYLATENNGRRFVLTFKRLGLNGAQPCFQVDKRMVPAPDLARFDVDRDVIGINDAKEAPSVYRYDFSEIDHPDAHLIAASPDMYEALENLVATMKAQGLSSYTTQATEALRKARGESQ